MSKYMVLLLLSLSVPFIVSFWRPLGFWRNWRALCLSILPILVIYGLWDVFAVWRGHWYFNPEGVGKLVIINLPLEEVLFFVVIPFCCIFTWEALNYIKKRIR